MKYGFTFPREHGLISIWAATLIFGLILGQMDQLSLLGFILSTLFSVIIILNYENIKLIIISRLRDIRYIPLISLITITVIVFVYRISLYTIIFFGILVSAVGIWAIITYRSKKASYWEYILGTFAVSLQFPIIYGTIYEISNLTRFIYIFSLWWIYSGILSVLIIHVGCYRGKLPHHAPLLTWSLYLVTFIPMYIRAYIEPITLLFLIEPSIRAVRQFIIKKTMRELKKNIRKIGWEMVYGNFTFIVLVLILSFLEVPLTKVY
ncbi:MAG: hypothetical protein INQ03_13590 [Candidatus Heimdallarchaeota archaeon]|nr:hypothetical protein [Candidatus Heimdallarchaeota archaeon]